MSSPRLLDAHDAASDAFRDHIPFAALMWRGSTRDRTDKSGVRPNSLCAMGLHRWQERPATLRPNMTIKCCEKCNIVRVVRTRP